MYKYLLSLLVFASFFGAAVAQQNNKTTIAPFKVTLTNGKTFTYNELTKNKSAILVYFSPTCEHCQKFTEAMLKRKKELSDKQIVMVSYLPLADVKKFDEQYHLSSNTNIKVGTEGYTFIIQKYYNVQRFPFVAEYNKQGKLTQVVPYNSAKPEEMAAQL